MADPITHLDEIDEALLHASLTAQRDTAWDHYVNRLLDQRLAIQTANTNA